MKHTHDCNNCVYLGTIAISTPDHSVKTIDCYYCENEETLVWRYGDEASYYGSTPISLMYSHLSLEASICFSLYLRNKGITSYGNTLKTSETGVDENGNVVPFSSFIQHYSNDKGEEINIKLR